MSTCDHGEDRLRELIRSDDDEARARGLYPHVRRMVRAAVGSRDPDLVESATTDALLAVCRYHHTFRGEARAGTWLHVVVRRAAFRAARREAAASDRLLSLTDEAVARAADTVSAVESHPAASADGLRHLERAVPNPAWRRLWLLRNDPLRALGDRELEELTGYTAGSVAVILSRVRARLAAAERGWAREPERSARHDDGYPG